MRIREEKQATDLRNTRKNFKLSALSPNSKFYVDVSEARTGSNIASVRCRIVDELQGCYDNNQDDADYFTYSRLLLIGHRGCGKSTELRLIQDELRDDYVTIYVQDIEQQQSRLTSQEDFLYYIVEKIVDYCDKDEILTNATYKQVEKLKRHLQYSIFGETDTEIIEIDKTEKGIKVEVGATISPFAKVLDFMGRLKYKETFADETKTTFNFRIRNTMKTFIEISNSILLAIQQECLKQEKMLLLILDGLDKVNEDVSEGIFLSTHEFLPDLSCSMIITFPLYLCYSSKFQTATYPFDKYYFLSTIPVNKLSSDNKPNPDLVGRSVLKQVIEKRMCLEKVLENPDNIEEAIEKSGGNLRDLFNFIDDAASNAKALGKDKIGETDFEVAYQEKKNSIKRQMNNSYKAIMKSVYNGTGKETIVTEKDETGTLLDLFNSGLLLEYNGKRWVDLNPLVREIMDEYGDRLWLN